MTRKNSFFSKQIFYSFYVCRAFGLKYSNLFSYLLIRCYIQLITDLIPLHLRLEPVTLQSAAPLDHGHIAVGNTS